LTNLTNPVHEAHPRQLPPCHSCAPHEHLLPALHAKDSTFRRSKLDLSASPQGANPPPSPRDLFILSNFPASLSHFEAAPACTFPSSPPSRLLPLRPPLHLSMRLLPLRPSLCLFPTSLCSCSLASLLLCRISPPVQSLEFVLAFTALLLCVAVAALIRPLPAALHLISLPPAASYLIWFACLQLL
jgi:hypothetical protein